MKSLLVVSSTCTLALLACAGGCTETEDQQNEPTLGLGKLSTPIQPEHGSAGQDQEKRAFVKAIPWEDYLTALATEQSADPTSVIDAGLEPALDAYAGTSCISPDSDYDGDTFVGADDVFPLRQGEHIADRPRIRAQFTSYIDAKLDYKYSNSTTITHDETRFYETDLIEKTDVKDTREFKTKFGGSLGLKLGFSLAGGKPTLSLDLGLGGEFERQRTYTWTRTKTESMQRKYTDIRKLLESSEISLEPSSGRVSGQVTLYNESDYALDVDVSNVRIAVVAHSPFTGAKYALGDVLLTGTFPLGYGSGNNFASSFVDLAGLNTFDMLKRLAEGWVFDMEIASYTAVDRNTGANVGSIISRVNQRNARLSIHYGDSTARAYGQVSVFHPGNQCLTGQSLLSTYVGAANVEFDRMPDATLIVKRINHRTNRFADRDFSSLTAAEQAQYGRWVVGYKYYNQPLTNFDLETSLLAPEDKVYFYYLTAADFREDAAPPDVNVTYTVANDGSAPLTQLVHPVSTWDTVELTVKNTFQIEELYSEFLTTSFILCNEWICGSDWYHRRVIVDSILHNINVPSVDWHGLQVDFGGQGYRTLAGIFADPDAQGSIISFRGFPSYDYVVRFRVTPAMLGSYPTRNLIIKSANPRQVFRVGYQSRYAPCGSCFWNELGGFHRNQATVKTWWKLDDADSDGDGFTAVARTGTDFDDGNPRRFPFAPEHLDGLDNDGDGSVDNSPMLCPAAVQSWRTGTCTLDNRMGWYQASPSTLLEQRWKRADGTFTAWSTVGSGLTTYTFTMPSDTSLAALQLRMTHYPSAGGSYSGVNTISLLPGPPPPISVAINGPSEVYHPPGGVVVAAARLPAKPLPSNTYTWSAAVSGGAAPFACSWTKTTPSGTLAVGSACSYTATFYYNGSCTTDCTTQFTLVVTVRDQVSQSTSASKVVIEHHSGPIEP